MDKKACIPVLLFSLALLPAGCKNNESSTTETTDTTVTTAPNDTAAFPSATSATGTSGTSTTGTSGTSASGTSGTSATSTTTTGTSTTAATPAGGKLSDKEEDFVKKANDANLAEIALGRDASQHATSPDVKSFAQKMISDHTAADQQLGQLATAKGMKVETKPPANAKEVKERLMKITGKKFDQAYMKQMVEDHEKVLKQLVGALGTTQDADLKSWIGNTIPAVQQHLLMARDLQGKLGK
jgi:putative membrane protein